MRSPNRPRDRRRTVVRRWCVPPVLLRASTETLDASPILDEFRDGEADLGVFFWQAVRDVLLWADTPPEERHGLFGPEGARWRRALLSGLQLDNRTTTAVGVLLDLVEKPGAATSEWVSRACVHLAHWAQARDAHGSALWFAQAAALARPLGGTAALEAGRMALASGDEPRGEAWLRRAIGVSRRTEDWSSYTRAYLELAAHYAGRGDYDRARRLYLLAARTARRKALRESRAMALHALVPLFARTGDFAAAERAGGLARLAYGAEHCRIPLLVRDMARLWVAAGQHQRALEAVHGLLTQQSEPEDRMQTLAVEARAIACGAHRAGLMTAFDAAWDLARNHAPGAARNQALSDLAFAALAAEEPRLVERVAQAAGVRFSFRTAMAEQVRSIVDALAIRRPSTRQPR